MTQKLDKLVKIKRNARGQLLPGQPSINPAGRPKGKSLKEFAREYLSMMTDEEKIAFMKKVGDETVWKMAEGNPHQDNNHSGEVKVSVELSKEIAIKNDVPTLDTSEDSNG